MDRKTAVKKVLEHRLSVLGKEAIHVCVSYAYFKLDTFGDTAHRAIASAENYAKNIYGYKKSIKK